LLQPSNPRALGLDFLGSRACLQQGQGSLHVGQVGLSLCQLGFRLNRSLRFAYALIGLSLFEPGLAHLTPRLALVRQILLAATGIAVGLHQLQALLMDRFHQYALFSIGSPDIIASAVPALAVVAGALRSLLTMAALAGVLVLLFQRTAKTWMRIAGILVAICSTLPGDIRTPGEFAVHYAVALAIAACAFAFFHFFGRRNYLAYALVLWLLALYQPTMQLLGNGNAYLEMHGWIVAAIMAASILWAVVPALAKTQTT